MATPSQCCKRSRLGPPDVLITDIRVLPSGISERIRLAEHLRDAHPNMGVVMPSRYADLG
jgi:hypothetical protein